MDADWREIKVALGDFKTSFSMQSCGGKDQVVRAAVSGGWQAYEPPLPVLIARHAQVRRSVFIDIGANTGFYSLLAASCGASRVFSFEPVPDIRSIFSANVQRSGLTDVIHISPEALGERPGSFELYLPDAGHGLIETSASLNKNFRKVHSAKINVQVNTVDEFFKGVPLDREDAILIKIDVESLESDVVMGGQKFIGDFLPNITAELLPNCDTRLVQFLTDLGYLHSEMRGSNLNFTNHINLSLEHRDHFFIHKNNLEEFRSLHS
jgi:FkbM family methyltransferase